MNEEPGVGGWVEKDEDGWCVLYGWEDDCCWSFVRLPVRWWLDPDCPPAKSVLLPFEGSSVAKLARMLGWSGREFRSRFAQSTEVIQEVEELA